MHFTVSSSVATNVSPKNIIFALNLPKVDHFRVKFDHFHPKKPIISESKFFPQFSLKKRNFCPEPGQNDHFRAKITNLRPNLVHFTLANLPF